MALSLPTNVNLKMSALQGKGKLVIFSCTAIAAVTMAAFTFLSQGGGLSSMDASATDVAWNGPVGVLDSDYKHLVTVGKISTAMTHEDYECDGVRDPMVAPSGALTVRRPAAEDGERAPAPTTLPNMWLSGIIWDPENPIAMIDGVDLHAGDTIKGARVVEIRIDSVVLTYASKRYVLTVE